MDWQHLTIVLASQHILYLQLMLALLCRLFIYLFIYLSIYLFNKNTRGLTISNLNFLEFQHLKK